MTSPTRMYCPDVGPITHSKRRPLAAADVGRPALQLDDDLPEEAVRFHQVEGRLRVLELEHLVHDRFDLVLLDEGIHRFEVLTRSHVDPTDRDARSQQRGRGDLAAESAETSDERDVPASGEACKGMR